MTLCFEDRATRFIKCGAYSLGDCIEDAHSQDEADRGHALACPMRPRTDGVVLVRTGVTSSARPVIHFKLAGGRWTILR